MSATTRAATAGRARRSRLPLPDRGGVRPSPPGRRVHGARVPTPAAATGPCSRRWSRACGRARAWCWRSRSRAPARCALGCRPPCSCSWPRPTRPPCGSASRAGGRTRSDQIDRRLRVGGGRARGPAGVSPCDRQRRPRDGRGRAGGVGAGSSSAAGGPRRRIGVSRGPRRGPAHRKETATWSIRASTSCSNMPTPTTPP